MNYQKTPHVDIYPQYSKMPKCMLRLAYVSMSLSKYFKTRKGGRILALKIVQFILCMLNVS